MRKAIIMTSKLRSFQWIRAMRDAVNISATDASRKLLGTTAYTVYAVS